MITLRKEQTAALDDSYPAFENRAATWLKSHFPEDCVMLGENAVYEKIRYGVQVAAQYGFLNRREVLKFVFLCFLLGPNFDLQPEYQGLKAIFMNSKIDPAARMQKVFETLAARLEKGELVVGGNEQPES
jgi:hypothetical protein